MTHADGNTYETTHFRTIGWIGAGLFAIAPPVFLYEWWLTFYTTAVEENPAIGPLMMLACFAAFASVPLMLVGRRRRYSAAPSVDMAALPGRMPGLRRRAATPAMPLDAS